MREHHKKTRSTPRDRQPANSTKREYTSTSIRTPARGGSMRRFEDLQLIQVALGVMVVPNPLHDKSWYHPK